MQHGALECLRSAFFAAETVSKDSRRLVGCYPLGAKLYQLLELSAKSHRERPVVDVAVEPTGYVQPDQLAIQRYR